MSKREYRGGYRRFKRATDTRPLRPSFLIVCEGECTEPFYFKKFRVSTRVVVVGTGDNTLNLVREAESRSQDDDYDFVWCVFDKDSFPPEHFNNAIKMAISKGFKVAYSNEAFELWYVLHFCYHQSSVSRSDYSKILDRYLDRAYEKNLKDIYDILLSHQGTAIQNARKLIALYNPHNPAKDNPCTTVYALVEKLNEFSI